MKKIICLLLTAAMLLSIVGCGGAGSSVSGPASTPGSEAASEPESESEPEPEPESGIVARDEYPANLFHGIYALEERDGPYGHPMAGGGTFVPIRFSHERIDAYKSYNKTAKIAAPYYNCTSGVQMDFYTDAETITFHYSVTDGFYDRDPEHPVDSFCIFENGEYKTSQEVEKGVSGDITYTRESSDAESRITIVFPNYHGISLSSLELGNTRPIDDYEHRILFLGDSITQGLFADKPSDSYVIQMCAALNAESMNLSVGGEIFRSEALDEDVNFDPTYIVVALGTNDFYGGIPATTVEENAFDYLTVLKNIYPGVPITVISPFSSSIIDVRDAVRYAAEDTGCHFIDGPSLIAPAGGRWHADNVHPSTAGFNAITEALTPILREQLGA